MLSSPAGKRVSDYIGVRALLSSLPNVDWLLGDRGYGADWFTEALEDKGMRACIPGRKQRNTPVKYEKRRYKRRSRLLTHVNMRWQVTHQDHVRSAQGLAARRNPI